MTDSGDKGDNPEKADSATPQAGVLGNLPRSRPSVRSPRRAAASAEPAAEALPPIPEADSKEEPGDGATQADLEALARTGVAIAGGAATLGLRIAGRAAAAVRGAVERR